MTTTTKRWKVVGDLIRTGRGTPELNAEYERLQAERLAAQPVIPARTIYDLPVARAMWKADAKCRHGVVGYCAACHQGFYP
jgi:hypothetical protein